jgi:hypothetical protein
LTVTLYSLSALHRLLHAIYSFPAPTSLRLAIVLLPPMRSLITLSANLALEIDGEVTRIALVVPALHPGVGAQRAVGEVELVVERISMGAAIVVERSLE